MIRPATSRDVDAMAGLAEGKRQAYADGPHGFHRSGPDARAVHAPFLARLLGRPDFLTLVHEDAAAVDGFLIARMARHRRRSARGRSSTSTTSSSRRSASGRAPASRSSSGRRGAQPTGAPGA